jgi:uncharacterized protein
MPEHLPDAVDPVAFAEKRGHLVGRLAIGGLDRIAPMVKNLDAYVDLDLQFGKQGRLPFIEGRVAAQLVLECQCCLGPMECNIDSKVRLGIVESVDAALLLPEDTEALIVEPDVEVLLSDIVQDELLLALPVIPQHDDCHLPGESPAAPSEARRNPFASLADLKLKSTSEE